MSHNGIRIQIPSRNIISDQKQSARDIDKVYNRIFMLAKSKYGSEFVKKFKSIESILNKKKGCISIIRMLLKIDQSLWRLFMLANVLKINIRLKNIKQDFLCLLLEGHAGDHYYSSLNDDRLLNILPSSIFVMTETLSNFKIKCDSIVKNIYSTSADPVGGTGRFISLNENKQKKLLGNETEYAQSTNTIITANSPQSFASTVDIDALIGHFDLVELGAILKALLKLKMSARADILRNTHYNLCCNGTFIAVNECMSIKLGFIKSNIGNLDIHLLYTSAGRGTDMTN